jgi:hypothetical protein
MPNWCSNKLTVLGDRAERDNFTNGFPTPTDDDSPIAFIMNYIPMPDGTENWYDWSLEHWGCKWGDCHTQIVEDDEDSIVLTFYTAWTPPEAAIQTISGMFPELVFTLTYDEPGMCFLGTCVFRNGKLVAQSEANFENGR